ncbi:DUF6314 family protein [Nocardioides mangrovi]|uniref:DUF6314 family protein n=1 Tax=Nocardioides mangrovi TaxID=2874580 RepID=A0ABS7UEX4_9ACTN|nr:DUF6314 family protein [Nocardioides mangrovi]MBZ5739197.1 DUF6314 family protein [Nocardioides mangrovi]
MLEPTALLGAWTLRRVVEDRLAGERRDVVGRAVLDLAAPDRVRWSEEGTMTWAGRSVPVSRTLHVVRTGAGDTGWEVRFSDGRLFHPWSVGAEVDHPCAPDHYRGRVETEGDPVDRWTVTWTARGPQKDYTMVTVHTPA